MEINIYIADLEAHNNGVLRGEWVKLNEIEEEELEEIIKKYSHNGQHDYAIHDYECEFMKINEFDNPMELLEIAKRTEDLREDQKIAFLAFLESMSGDVNEALDTVEDENYYIYSLGDGISESDQDEYLGYELVENDYISIPEEARPYFNYEAYGRNHTINATGGYIDFDNCTYFVEFNY